LSYLRWRAITSQWEEVPKDNRLTDVSSEHENSFFLRANRGIVWVEICDGNLAEGPFLWPMVGVCKWVSVYGDIGMTQAMELKSFILGDSFQELLGE
jgi:hypothetical protein